jgi:arylsulfatase A-like enzyme
VRGLPLDAHVSATQLDPDASLETGADDGKLVTHVLSEIGALKQPFLSVVHLSNTHFPYAIDDADAPWQPQSAATGPGYEAEVLNRYRDSIYHQDRAVGRLLRELRASPLGASTVVVFLSDHGEQMREKGAVGHTGTLFEQEIRVPAWVDAPPGTLTSSEEASLRARADAPTTTLDVLPTLLDLAGLWDAPELAPFRATMPGQSLLRGGTPADRAVLLTNCTELWQCAFKNWGAMQGTRKLIAHQYDPAWSCFDVKDDPRGDPRPGRERVRRRAPRAGRGERARATVLNGVACRSMRHAVRRRAPDVRGGWASPGATPGSPPRAFPR